MHYRKKDDFVVVKYGAEWCGPCKAAKPIMEKLAIEYPSVYFLDVDVETGKDDEEDNGMIDHPDFINVRSIPHFKFFIGKELINEFTGNDSERLKRYVDRYFKQALIVPEKEMVEKKEEKDNDQGN
jgi:thiol-disulfide isomerase/thioredoxin